MKSVKRTIVRVVTYNKRKRTATLRPKGTESDYNGYSDVIVDGRTIPGLQMASKAFIGICDVELGKLYMLPLGRDPVRANDGIEGRGTGKKRMAPCNEAYKGSKFALTRKGADLPAGVSLYARWQNVSSSITPIKCERLADIQPKSRLTDIAWKKVETHVNRLQARITKAVKPNCCPIQKGL